eukprot:gene30691-35718_t
MQRYDDWRVVAAAYVLPPLAYLAASRFIIRPMNAWARRWAEQQAANEYTNEVESVMRASTTEQALLAPVARRKARAEVEKGGLVILEAVYGVLGSYWEEQEKLGHGVKTAAGLAASARGARAADGMAAGTSDSASSSATPSWADPASEDASSSFPIPPKFEDASSSFNLPPKWMRVVGATQYLVVDGRLILYEGPPKSGLMGFADPAPRVTSGKELYVAYLADGAVYEVTVGDTSRLVLPVPKLDPLADDARATHLISIGELALGIQIPKKTPTSAL